MWKSELTRSLCRLMFAHDVRHQSKPVDNESALSFDCDGSDVWWLIDISSKTRHFEVDIIVDTSFLIDP